MDQNNSDLVLELDAPNPIPPGACIAQGDSDFDSELHAQNSIPPGPNTAQGGPSQDPVNTAYLPLFEAVRSGDLDATTKFLNDHPEAVKAKITSRGETALHIATFFQHLHIVRELVQLMSEDDLLLMDNDQFMALTCACVNPTTKTVNAAKCMVEKNKNLVIIRSFLNQIPITLALHHGHIEMARYLYSVTPFDALLPENGEHGAVFLNQCVICRIFDIALDLITRCPRLVLTSLGESNFWVTLAAVPSALHSEIQPPFWKRRLHNWVHVHQEPACNIPKITGRTGEYHGSSTSRGIKKINEASLAHMQYLELLHAACNVLRTLNAEELRKTNIYTALVAAARRGNSEFIVEAVKMNLTLLWTMDMEGKRLFHLAVRFRQAKVFNLIHGLVLKYVVNFTDNDGNTMLHMAGELAPPTQLNHISGALLQMQRELQWFKKVESIMSPLKKDHANNDGLTARELFTREHKDLVKEGEKWTKGTASSCSVVAALVVTITFAVAFTVPGGNDQTTGYPIFLHKTLFMVFAISNAVSLFSSSTSLLMFLGLLTSRYAEDDFLKSLPKRLIIGLSTMFISIATMMIAFCAALFLMLQNQYSWIVIPVTMLASVPVTLYIWLQVPLLVEIFMSTYGPGIFDRNIKPWP